MLFVTLLYTCRFLGFLAPSLFTLQLVTQSFRVRNDRIVFDPRRPFSFVRDDSFLRYRYDRITSLRGGAAICHTQREEEGGQEAHR